MVWIPLINMSFIERWGPMDAGLKSLGHPEKLDYLTQFSIEEVLG